MKTDYEKTLDAIHDATARLRGHGLKTSVAFGPNTKEIKFNTQRLRIHALFHESGKAIDPDFATIKAIFAAIGVNIEE